MAIKPILFNTKMVRAILNGEKTQTRRAVKDKDIINNWDCESDGTPIAYIDQSTGDRYSPTAPCSYNPGDILWVPEAWKCVGTYGELGYEVVLRNGPRIAFEFESLERARKWAKYRDKSPHQWQSPYFMPKEAARIFLRVKDVRVERLKNITGNGLRLEGMKVKPLRLMDSFSAFSSLWDSTIKKADLPRYGWDANPWVWVIEFELCEEPEGWCSSE